MPHRGLVLIEHLGAPGASLADARSRATLLRECGCTVRVLVADPACGGVDDPGDRAAASPARFGLDRRSLAALRARLAGLGAAGVVLASPEPDGGPAGRELPPGVSARWWPTAAGLDGAREPAGLPPIGTGLDALAWGVVDRPHGRRARLPLWDGDYVLAPLALEGQAGAEALAAFARVAEDDHALDLVVLADPQPPFEAAARRLGVGMRVHFAGAAPREAEFAWWTSASAALIATESRFAAGLVWRGLERGCPLIVAGEGPVPSALRAWLDGHGCLAGPRAGGDAALAGSLERALVPGAEARLAVGRGRALALAQARTLPRRLAAALGLPPASRAGAARAPHAA